MLVNPLIDTVIWWAVFFVVMVVAIKIFDLVTPYKLSQETKEKNGALGAVLGGLLIGIGIIIYNSMAHSDTLLNAVTYSATGFVLMLLSYFLYDLITPEKINQEIDDHNLLVGYKIAGLFIAVALVVSGAIT